MFMWLIEINYIIIFATLLDALHYLFNYIIRLTKILDLLHY